MMNNFRCDVCNVALVEGNHKHEGTTCFMCLAKRNILNKAESVELWLRLGVTLKVTGEEASTILDGDSDAIYKAIKSGNWRVDGDAYVPDTVANDFGYPEVGFDLWMDNVSTKRKTRAIHFNEIQKGDRVVVPDDMHLCSDMLWEGDDLIVATSDAYQTKTDYGKIWNFESGDGYVYIADFDVLVNVLAADDSEIAV